MKNNRMVSELVKAFNIKEYAIEELKKYESIVIELNTAFPFYSVTEYFVQEGEYKDEGKRVAGGDVLGFSEMNLSGVAQ